MRRQPDLTINGIVFPVPSAGEIEQTYTDVGGFSNRRLASGALLYQERWRKVESSITGSGWIPAALASIDWTAQITVGCIATRALQSLGRVFNLPAGRRLDAAPYGFAHVGHRLAPTAVALAGNVATLAEVAGATAYSIHYYPVIVGRSDGPQERYDAAGAVAGFDLTVQEG